MYMVGYIFAPESNVGGIYPNIFGTVRFGFSHAYRVRCGSGSVTPVVSNAPPSDEYDGARAMASTAPVAMMQSPLCQICEGSPSLNITGM